MALERDVQFGTGERLADLVIRVDQNVGSVIPLGCGADMADNAVLANFEPFALLVVIDGPAAYGCDDQFVRLFIL